MLRWLHLQLPLLTLGATGFGAGNRATRGQGATRANSGLDQTRSVHIKFAGIMGNTDTIMVE